MYEVMHNPSDKEFPYKVFREPDVEDENYNDEIVAQFRRYEFAQAFCDLINGDLND